MVIQGYTNDYPPINVDPINLFWMKTIQNDIYDL